MIEIDPYVVTFISGNYLTVTLSLTLLKGWAKISKNNTTNAISDLLSGLWESALKPMKRNGKMRKIEEEKT